MIVIFLFNFRGRFVSDVQQVALVELSDVLSSGVNLIIFYGRN